MILQQLSQIQSRCGYLPRGELAALADRLAVPLFRIEEVVSFYPHFRKTPPKEVEIDVCRDMACCLRGSLELTAAVAEELASEVAAGRVAVRSVSCLGRCDRAVAARMHVPGLPAADGGHEPVNFLGCAAEEIATSARALLRGETGVLAGHSGPRLVPAKEASHAWRIDVYAGKPRSERYAALRQTIEAIRRGTASGDAARDRIIQAALKNAVLLGMGGAGGQAFKKWCEVREAVGERKYVVCNADESEPGTFKDRELLLQTPFLVVEGVLLAAVVLGAEQAYIYVRHEYEECIAALNAEIAWAREQGLCGERILGSDVGVDVEVFVSPGGYICGEQTALIQAIQDQRAEPRNRPPELQTNGLWDMPTLVNNVETLAWAPAVVLMAEGGPLDGDPKVSGRSATAGTASAVPGTQDSVPGTKYSVPSTQNTAPSASRLEPPVINHQPCRALEKSPPRTQLSWYASQGRPFGELAALILNGDKDWQRRHGSESRFPGLRMFSVSGDVVRPGVYEVENGITFGELIELAGGIRGREKLKAVALSGPSGGFTPAVLPRGTWPRKVQKILPASIEQVELADLQMHINYFRLWDLMLGAGIVVYGESADLVQQALACLRFFQAESCGKCVPCRIGSTKLAEIGAELAAGRLNQQQIDALAAPSGIISDLAFTMASTAICGLGTVAPNPLTTLLRHFPGEIQAYRSEVR